MKKVSGNMYIKLDRMYTKFTILIQSSLPKVSVTVVVHPAKPNANITAGIAAKNLFFSITQKR